MKMNFLKKFKSNHNNSKPQSLLSWASHSHHSHGGIAQRLGKLSHFKFGKSKKPVQPQQPTGMGNSLSGSNQAPHKKPSPFKKQPQQPLTNPYKKIQRPKMSKRQLKKSNTAYAAKINAAHARQAKAEARDKNLMRQLDIGIGKKPLQPKKQSFFSKLTGIFHHQKPKKHTGTMLSIGSRKATREEQLMINQNPEANFQAAKVRTLRSQLHGPAKLLPGSQIFLYAKMNTNPSKINGNSWFVFLQMIIFVSIAIFCGLKIKPMYFAFVFLAPLALWYIDYVGTKEEYQKYRFKRQLMFNKFMTILDLSEVKRGLSINELLGRAAKRVDSRQMRLAIDTLNSRIQDDPSSPDPYNSFANQFSDTPNARLFMQSIYRMAQGYYDDANIKSLKHNAAKGLSYQSHVLMTKKLSRYYKLRHMTVAGFVFTLIVYLLLFIGIKISQVM